MKYVSLYSRRLVLLIFFVFLLFGGCYGCYFYYSFHGKNVHLSFDDCYLCLKDLTTDSTKYKCLFEQPFFADLKDLHESTGAKFTLYTYEEVNDFNIAQLPAKYVKEIKDNCDWLKIGYHAKNPTISKDSIGIYKVFTESYTKVDSILVSKSIGGGGQIFFNQTTFLFRNTRRS